MSKINQAIYTSSAKGVRRTSGGQGIYSFNPSMTEEELREFSQHYVGYSVAKGNEGADPSEYPKRFIFSEFTKDRLAAANITYLGRDYLKDAGRMGNILSHILSFKEDELTCYPMELYGSSQFRTSMRQDEVDGSTNPEYLEDLQTLERGTAYTLGTVQRFIKDGRKEMFFRLIAAVFSRDNINKVIIYDEEENVRLWIAALQYALPLSIVKTLTFSTFEPQPLYSPLDIRGAVAGFSQFPSPDWMDAPNQHFVFNGITKTYPEFPVGEDFFVYGIDMGMGMSFGYDSLQHFHSFIEDYTYRKADWEICDAYLLFQMLGNGMSSMAEVDIEKALKFERKYGTAKTAGRMSVSMESVGSLREFEVYSSMAGVWVRGLKPGKEQEEALNELLDKFCQYMEKQPLQKETCMMHLIDAFTSVYHWCRHTAVYLSKRFTEEADRELVNRMWNRVVEHVLADKTHARDFLSDCSWEKLYYPLSCLCARMLEKDGELNPMEMLSQMLDRYFKDMPKEQGYCLDALVGAADRKIRQDEKTCYENQMVLFTNTEKEFGGEVYGPCTDELIEEINAQTTCFEKKKRFKKEDTLSELQTKCALYAFNYKAKHGTGARDTNLRMLHLGRNLLKLFVSTGSWEDIGPLKIYGIYPVNVTKVDKECFGDYLDWIFDGMEEMEMRSADYEYLMKCMEMTFAQKEDFLEGALEREQSWIKDTTAPFCAVIGACLRAADEDWKKALGIQLSGMKDSKKEKIREAVVSEFGRNSQEYTDWSECCHTLGGKEKKENTVSSFFKKWKKD